VSELLDRLTVESLPPGFKPGGFDSEEPDVVAYICDGSASQDQFDGLTKTYLVKDGDELVGYFSICCDAIKLSKDERPTPRHPGAPALKIGYMGRQKKYAGQNVGEWILKQVAGIARNIGEAAGIRFITLDSLPREGLVTWYKSQGFLENLREAEIRKILKSERSRKLSRATSLEEIDLPHISMRFDIRLKAEVPKS
jgi:GNAT superfamily N-acetyltransferase